MTRCPSCPCRSARRALEPTRAAAARSSRRARADGVRTPRCQSCWEAPDHPDGAARTLRKVAAALAGEWDHYTPESGLPLYAAWGFEDVGIFFGAAAATATPRRADRGPPAARRARSCVACARARAVRLCEPVSEQARAAHTRPSDVLPARAEQQCAGQSRGGGVVGWSEEGGGKPRDGRVRVARWPVSMWYCHTLSTVLVVWGQVRRRRRRRHRRRHRRRPNLSPCLAG